MSYAGLFYRKNDTTTRTTESTSVSPAEAGLFARHEPSGNEFVVAALNLSNKHIKTAEKLKELNPASAGQLPHDWKQFRERILAIPSDIAREQAEVKEQNNTFLAPT